jgi:excisionase family DNA binding protein
VKLLSTKEAAEMLNVSPIRVRQLIQDGKLRAKRIGRDYVIDEKDLALVQTYGKAGRPKKGE